MGGIMRKAAIDAEIQRRNYIAELRKKFTGKKIATINSNGLDLLIKFDDGTEMPIKVSGSDLVGVRLYVDEVWFEERWTWPPEEEKRERGGRR